MEVLKSAIFALLQCSISASTLTHNPKKYCAFLHNEALNQCVCKYCKSKQACVRPGGISVMQRLRGLRTKSDDDSAFIGCLLQN